MNNTREADEDPVPTGELMTRVLVLPADTNADGDVFGGWIMSQMDLAGSIKASNIARGRVATVAVGAMVFLRPVPIGSTICCYAEIEEVGRSSVRVLIDVWVKPPQSQQRYKLTESSIVYVAIDDSGRTRSIQAGRDTEDD